MFTSILGNGSVPIVLSLTLLFCQFEASFLQSSLQCRWKYYDYTSCAICNIVSLSTLRHIKFYVHTSTKFAYLFANIQKYDLPLRYQKNIQTFLCLLSTMGKNMAFPLQSRQSWFQLQLLPKQYHIHLYQWSIPDVVLAHCWLSFVPCLRWTIPLSWH